MSNDNLSLLFILKYCLLIAVVFVIGRATVAPASNEMIIRYVITRLGDGTVKMRFEPYDARYKIMTMPTNSESGLVLVERGDDDD